MTSVLARPLDNVGVMNHFWCLLSSKLEGFSLVRFFDRKKLTKLLISSVRYNICSSQLACQAFFSFG